MRRAYGFLAARDALARAMRCAPTARAARPSGATRSRRRFRYYGMKRLSAYGLAVTLVCQINSSIMSFREKVKKRREWEAAMAEKAAEVAKRSNPKKKNS